jgi:RNA recognition motif-containing protein
MSLIDSIFGSSSTQTQEEPSQPTTSNVSPTTTTQNTTSDLFTTVIHIPDQSPLYSYRQSSRRKPKRKTADGAAVVPLPNDEPAQTKKRKVNSKVNTETENNDATTGSEVNQQGDDEHTDDPMDGTLNAETVDVVNARTVFVGNLPITYTRKKLRQLFLDCGTIQSTRIRCVALPSQSAVSDGTKNTKSDESATTTTTKTIKLPPALAGQQQIYKKVCINTTAPTTVSSTSTTGAKNSMKQSVIGYVVFENVASVERALLKNNMAVSIVPDIDASVTPTTTPSSSSSVRHIRVDRVGQDTELRDPKRTIFIGNLPYRTDEETLQQHIVHHLRDDVIINNTTEDSHGSGIDSIVESIRIVRDKETYECKGFAYVLFTSNLYVPIALRKLHQTTYMKQELRIQVCGKRTKKMNPTPSKASLSSPSSVPIDAVGALKRVLKKQLLQTTSSNSKHKKINVRKRGPTRSSNTTSDTANVQPNKKSNSKGTTSSKQQAKVLGKRIQHKLEQQIQKAPTLSRNKKR